MGTEIVEVCPMCLEPYDGLCHSCALIAKVGKALIRIKHKIYIPNVLTFEGEKITKCPLCGNAARFKSTKPEAIFCDCCNTHFYDIMSVNPLAYIVELKRFVYADSDDTKNYFDGHGYHYITDDYILNEIERLLKWNL